MMSDLFLTSENALVLVFKLGIIIFLLIYLIFAGVVIKQARMMTDTLELGFEGPIKLIAVLHFLFSLFVLILAIFIL